MFKRRKPDEIPGQKPMPPLSNTLPSNATPNPSAPSGPAQFGLDASAAKLEVGMPSPDPFNAPARPAPKEATMGRTPYPNPNQPTPPTPPQPGAPQPAPGMAPRPGVQPGRPREPAERRTLVVGRGISVQGTVQDAERLVVEGTVEASMIHATELSIAHGGIFKGAVEVEDAEIAGTIDGNLTVRANLVVRATGKVLGTAHYRRLQVEDGGQITGELKMITEPARNETLRPQSAEASVG